MMNKLKLFFRLIYIQFVLAKYSLDRLLVAIPLFSTVRFITFLNPWNWFRKNNFNRAKALRLALQELGPIFVKFGQALSTRKDVLPADIALELSMLQDKVSPFSDREATRVIETALGQEVGMLFSHFEPTPFASASIAQVHAATLLDGKEAVLKVLRPGIKKTIEQDIKLMRTMARLIDKYFDKNNRLRAVEVINEFELTLLDELDLMKEAANASQLKRNFQHSNSLYVPEIYWQYSRSNVLCMERIYGVPVSDVNQLKAHNINIKKLAERGVEIFFTQVFKDCFFHADMHPGNIFVSFNSPDNPQYICVDFGIVGSLTDEDKRYLAENLLAFLKRDYRRVAQLHIDSGWVPRDTRITTFESAIRAVCEPIVERPLKDISFAQVILNLLKAGRQFEMIVQPQLLLLQKTLFAIEGLGRQLYPELNIWHTAKPILEKWLKEEVGPKAFIRNLKQTIPFINEQLPYLPQLTYQVLQEYRIQQQTKPKLIEEKQGKENSKSRFWLALTWLIFPPLAFFLADKLKHDQLLLLAGLISGSGMVLFLKNRFSL